MEAEQNKSEEENESESEEMDEKLDSAKENGIIENSGTCKIEIKHIIFK